MFQTKLRIVTPVLITAGIFGTGAGVGTLRALADQPAPIKAAAAEPDQKQGKKQQGPSVAGVVRAVDAGKHTLTLAVPLKQTKQTEDRTFPLARDVQVALEDAPAKKPPAAGKLADLTEGTPVVVLLAEDGRTITAVRARGPSLRGAVKAVDAAANTLTVNVKEGGGVAEKALALATGAKVLLNDGLSKDQADKEGKLADLAEGTPVVVHLSVDRQRALSIRVQGTSVGGELKGIDTGANTVTLTVKEDGARVDRTFSLAKNARVEGNPTAGQRVVVRLSVFDKQTAVAVQAAKQ
jgi:small nuclear ribonucleoprotein (snRNP)-like protein